MDKTILSFACFLLVSGVVSQVRQELFTTGLLKELAKSQPEKNIVFSPTSLESAMSIVGFGAKGDTEKELWTGLGLKSDVAKQYITEKQEVLSEAQAPGAAWQMANRILVAPDIPLKQTYLNEVSQSFPRTVVDNFKFESLEKTAQEVNSWVAQNTNNVINKLLDAKSIDERTKMIILNAVYFKGEWKHGFDKKRTKKECFFSKPNQCTETDMMHIKEDFKYGYHNGLNAEIIEFPYKNENFSMIVLLPDGKVHDLTTFLSNKLDVDEIINFIDSKNYPVEVHVTMPKFEIEFEKEIKSDLMNLGIRTLFTDRADLSGMIDNYRTSVSSVIHKAKITCDEEGTVAAAATGIQVVPYSLIISKPNYFIANRPFLFFLRSKQSGVLFNGQKVSF